MEKESQTKTMHQTSSPSTLLKLPKNGLPKRWQKFGDLIYVPSGVELSDKDILIICEKYKVKRIAQQNIVVSDDIRTPG